MERMTRANLDERCANLNRRMEQRGSIYRYAVEGRYDYTALDRIRADGGYPVGDAILCGTNREVGDALHYMMVALDDASYVPETV